MAGGPHRRWSVEENLILEALVDANKEKILGKRGELARMIYERLNECAPDDNSRTVEKVRYKMDHYINKLKRGRRTSRAKPTSPGLVGEQIRLRDNTHLDSVTTCPSSRRRQVPKVVMSLRSSTGPRRKLELPHPPTPPAPVKQYPGPKLSIREIQGPRQERMKQVNAQTLPRAALDSELRGTTTTASDNERSARSMMEVEPWERKHIEILRSLMAQGSYSAPPRHSHVRTALSNITLQIEHSIECYRQAHPCSYLDLTTASDDARDLSQVSFTASTPSTVVDMMETASSHPAIWLDDILQLFISNAVFTWAFNGFKEDPQTQMPSAVQRTFNRLAQYDPEAVRRLNIATKLDLLDATVKPRLPVYAEEFQIRLFNIFKSMRVAPSETDPACEVACGSPEYSQAKHREFKKITRTVFLDTLSLRADLARCDRKYFAQFFKQGEPFDEESMEPHRQDMENAFRDSTVYICLRPAILSFPRESDSEAPSPSQGVVVVKAKVVVTRSSQA
ncbi:hypothetical protein G647_08665 [Cladophialophora carrionii CBS 160.54]|uniref:Uncharacterized protein n=1 Tax=Cladophialophora carrionii CBS 160.54 TaxID=1279043 RepID=V9D048_9EURO|nr:uncharacterized protein G647_08665 [Cladophialophora carrionii CBS 160.54]ETI19653.1 hypothetical protein G647_08665 [Cladophialophora carrionii CBS 160.54]